MYFAIKCEQTKVVGPYDTWQEACLGAFGCIDTKFKVKWLGNEPPTKSSLTIKLSDRSDWFSPLILENPLGLTFQVEEALGPKEISERLKDIVDRMKTAETSSDFLRIANEANPYLRAIPESVRLSFEKVSYVERQRFDLREGGEGLCDA